MTSRHTCAAFAAIDADPAQLLVVLDDGGVVVGTMQLTLHPRAVPWRRDRGAGRGGPGRGQPPRAAARRADDPVGGRGVRRDAGCALVQLTTDKSRADAHRFYERLGFTASHEGFKMVLGRAATGRRTTKERAMSGSGTKDDPWALKTPPGHR